MLVLQNMESSIRQAKDKTRKRSALEEAEAEMIVLQNARRWAGVVRQGKIKQSEEVLLRSLRSDDDLEDKDAVKTVKEQKRVVKKRTYSVEELRLIRNNVRKTNKLSSTLSPFSGGDVICEGWIDSRRGSSNASRQKRNSSSSSIEDMIAKTAVTSSSTTKTTTTTTSNEHSNEWRRGVRAERRKQWRCVAKGFGLVVMRKHSYGFIRCLKSDPDDAIEIPAKIFFHMNRSSKEQENLPLKINEFVAFSIEEDRNTKNLNAVNVRRADLSECPELVLQQCRGEEDSSFSSTNNIESLHEKKKKIKKRSSESDVMNWRGGSRRDPTPSTSSWRHFRRAGDPPVRTRRPYKKKTYSSEDVSVAADSPPVVDEEGGEWEIAGAKRRSR